MVRSFSRVRCASWLVNYHFAVLQVQTRVLFCVCDGEPRSPELQFPTRIRIPP